MQGVMELKEDMNEAEDAVIVKDLHFSYADHEVLHGLNLSLKKGSR